ncbi:hypothetical protein Micbo1qcDRAFT_192202 [Microdochium bolleyi]|uniref:C2H2-type domain-containing protein n=1 Tax=Microdochium bolleyi TaxID=196109 RepID=A0A136JD52_9PEZI|nr:hypothetical protein Micbo1qcDRAFT_192202 [Microdochium bolleyi]
MSDLRFIMDMDDHEPGPRLDKRIHEPSLGPNRGSNPSRPAPMNQDYHDHPASASLSRPLDLTSRPPTSSASTTPVLSTVSDSGDLSRRESTASTESMDPLGYGSRGRGTSSGSMRPMGSPTGGDTSVRLTPITRRISRAKKGVPVHTCEICRPAKTFTRAEHLRRHNLSHANPRFPCLHPGCDKVFHRQDLLNRHKTRHYGGESSSSYGAETYGNSSGQAAPTTVSPSHSQPQQPDYGRQYQHMSRGSGQVDYSASNEYRMPQASPGLVPAVQHQPPYLNNAPTTPPPTFNHMAYVYPETVLGLDGHKDSELGVPPFHMGNHHITAMALPQAILSSVPGYLKVYWECFDVQFPLVHRASFEASGSELLRCAMGAIATQFMPEKEDHVKGKQLHEFAVAELRRTRVLDNLPTMQAILLCEYYARFRGRKVVVNASRVFREVYTRVNRDQATPGMATPAMDVVSGSQEQRWRRWADIEARRRLQTGCFLLDVNTALLYEQPLLKPITATSPPIPLTVQTGQQWKASTASSWELATSASDPNMPLAFSPMVDTLTSDRLSSAPPLDIAVYLAAEVLRILPVGSRTKLNSLNHADLAASEYLQRLFSWSPMASTYTALSYTPLHDLLAVSGDSWIFAIKVLTTEQFREHQTRLKDWCRSRQALCAAKYAAKALCSFLGLDDDDDDVVASATNNATNDNVSYEDRYTGHHPLGRAAQNQHTGSQLGLQQPPPQAQRNTFARAVNYKISDYWAAYVCALICWAVCHQAEVSSAANRSGYANSGSAQPQQHQLLPSCEGWQPQDWLRQAASASSPDELAHLPSAGIASGIVGLARLRLQYEAVGGTSGLLNDALDVLSKLQDRGTAAFLSD